MKKLFSLIVSAALLASITLTGCAGPSGAAPGGSVSAGEKSEGTSSAGGAPKTFIFPADQDVTNLLPSSGGSDSVATIFKPLYDPLFIINNQETRYYLVDKLEISEDELSIKMHFNEKAKWHDGQPVTVDDFLFTLKYMEEGATRSNTTLTKINDERIVYEKVDDYNVNITLPSHLSKFITILGRTFIYPAHVFGNDVTTVETSDAAMLGIGNGPFKLKEWAKGEHLLYEKNTEYYRSPAKIDQIIMKIIPDSSAKEVAFQSGEVSCIRISSKEKFEKYAADENYNIFQSPECRVNYFTCNPISDKITSKEAREAIFHAINLDEIMQTVYGSEVMSKPGTTIFCDQNLYFDSQLSNYTYDLEKAKELAVKSGMDQVTLKYIYNNQRVGMPEVAVVIQQQLKAAGINVELQSMDSPSFFSMFFGWSRDGATNEWDLGTNGWDSLQGDPSTQIVSYAINPEATDCSPETQEALLAACNAATDAERDELFKKTQKLIQDDYTIYPISCPNYVWASQKNVTGLDSINSMIPFEDWTLIEVE